jgi:hypothetical protein
MAGVHMQQHLTRRALERAQWFSDLTRALTEAEKLLKLMEADGGFPLETARLRQRVETVRIELDLLNRAIPTQGRIVNGEWPSAKAG